MIVKNLNGTSDNPTCPCGSWLNIGKTTAVFHADYALFLIVSKAQQKEPIFKEKILMTILGTSCRYAKHIMVNMDKSLTFQNT